MAKGYSGWKLEEAERSRLLAMFPPVYENVVAHHITDEFGVDDSHWLPLGDSAEVIGIADDGEGVQALVVAVDQGGVHPVLRRKDGKRYHVTWSLANGRKAVESNDVIQRSFANVDSEPFVIIPAFFPFKK